ncbi:hypothetical protein ACN081_03380 [Rothia sp. P13129]|uniref:hypothetical protein n=1 Tax=Rothia sp. P13129 TaxID=3402664 RepID=UPI003AD115FE
MTTHTLSSEFITAALHPVFDEQIINYGAYNLIFATGHALYRNPDIAIQQQDSQEYFIIGYRDTPREVIVAPVLLPQASPAGTPTSIDNTNAIRAYSLNEDTFGLESTTGTSFILTIPQSIEIVLENGSGVLEQSSDILDFQNFLSESWLED